MKPSSNRPQDRPQEFLSSEQRRPLLLVSVTLIRKVVTPFK